MSRCARQVDEKHCIDQAHGDSGTVQLGFHGSAEAIGLGDPALVRRTERSFAKSHSLGLEAFNFGRYRGTPCRDLRRRAECRGSIRKAREVMAGLVEGIVNRPEIYKCVLPEIKTPAFTLRGHRTPANAGQSTNKFHSREILAERTTGPHPGIYARAKPCAGTMSASRQTRSGSAEFETMSFLPGKLVSVSILEQTSSSHGSDRLTDDIRGPIIRFVDLKRLLADHLDDNIGGLGDRRPTPFGGKGRPIFLLGKGQTISVPE